MSKRTPPYDKSFATHKNAKYWDYSKNKLKPEECYLNANKKAWFKCTECNHGFDVSLNSMVRHDSFCPYCIGRKLCQEDCEKCFNKSFAACEQSLYWDFNKNTVSPREIFRRSKVKYWFLCIKCDHSFHCSTDNLAPGISRCPYCSTPPQKLCQEDCESCYNKSFASHEKSKYWDYNKNKVSPREVIKGTHKNYWFNCDCGHNFDNNLDAITSNGKWCIYCAHRKLCDNDCDMCFNNSFASHEKSKCWDFSKNKLTPREVFKSTNVKYWFNCSCGHSFMTTPNHITCSGKWCNYCAHGWLCEDDNCNMCFNNSFASHERADSWDYAKNELKPRDYFKYSAEKCWFICENKHEFNVMLGSVTSGSWCIKCKNKTEKKFYDAMIYYYTDIQCQYKADWCKNRHTGINLPFDFLLPEQKIIIEVDGRQHFQQVLKWASSEYTRIRDIYKMQCANKNGYRVIRIIQEDIYHDRTDWIMDIISNVDLMEEDKSIMNVFICYKDEYKNHKDLSIITMYDENYVEPVKETITEQESEIIAKEPEAITQDSTKEPEVIIHSLDKSIIVNNIEYIDDLSELL